MNLHHTLQTQDGPIAEVTDAMHFDAYGKLHWKSGTKIPTSQPDEDSEYPVLAWNPGVPDGGLMEKIADSCGEFALTECRQNLS